MKTHKYAEQYVYSVISLLLSIMISQSALSQTSNNMTASDDAQLVSDLQADSISDNTDIEAIIRDAVATHPRIITANTRVCQARHSLDLAKTGDSMVITGALESNSKLAGNVPKTGSANVRGRSFNTDFNKEVDLKLRLSKTLWNANRTKYAIGSENFRYQAEATQSLNQTSELLLSMLTMLVDVEFNDTAVQLYQRLLSDVQPLFDTIDACGTAGRYGQEKICC